VQVGVEDLPLAQHRALAGLRFLDLDDHLGRGEDLGGGRGNHRSGLLVDLVGGADAASGTGFDRHLMAMATISRTDDGVRPTRYSWFLISLGTPMCIAVSFDLQADCARSGEEAVTLAASERYALILMDLQLPAIDGMEATRRIRQLPHCASVPIIALSGRSDDDVADACQQAGMNDFVAKPFSLGVLLDTVTRWLRSSPPA
jgi:CheY-like chemotaxis protein